MVLQLKPVFINIAACFLSLIPILNRSVNAQQLALRSFYCGIDQGVPATLVNHPRMGTIVFIRWHSSFFNASGWSASKRCEAVSARFQKNKENGTLAYIMPGNLNSLPVLCGSSRKDGSCSNATLLFTLNSRRDADLAIRTFVDCNRNLPSLPYENSCGESAIEIRRDGLLVLNVETFLQYLASRDADR